jgi:hypothetical protein
MLVIALRERQLKAVWHLGRHGRYNLRPVFRYVHYLTFSVSMPSLDDPSRQRAGASYFAFELI